MYYQRRYPQYSIVQSYGAPAQEQDWWEYVEWWRNYYFQRLTAAEQADTLMRRPMYDAVTAVVDDAIIGTSCCSVMGDDTNEHFRSNYSPIRHCDRSLHHHLFPALPD
jgi:hypothetical protein